MSEAQRITTLSVSDPTLIPAPPVPAVQDGPAVPPPAHLMPLRASERIEFIDMLRGAALFGILAANMRGHAAPAATYSQIDLLFPGFADRFAQGLIDVFISAKFITLFACLFGLGLAVQIGRAEARGVRVSSFYPRRMLVLAGIGVLHGALIWWGDILFSYALIGFALLALRHVSPKHLLRTIGGILLGVMIVATTSFVFHQLSDPQAPPERPERAPQELARIIAVYHDGSEVARATENFHAWTRFLPHQLGLLAFLPTFLFGLWLWRSGVAANLPAHGPALRRVCATALPLGLLLGLFAWVTGTLHGDAPQQPTLLILAATLAGYYSLFLLASGYAAGLALLAQQTAWHRRLAVFVPVGRLALTNYLMQSVLCLAFFRATGLFGRVGPAWGLLVTVVLYGVQVWFSTWWLARYRFGPFEYVWRTLTYGSLGPLRRTPTAA